MAGKVGESSEGHTLTGCSLATRTIRPLTGLAARRDGLIDPSRKAAEMELILELAYWLLRSGARYPRHVAAILTATAIPSVMMYLLLDSGVTAEFGSALFISCTIGGIAIAVPSEGLGADPHKWRDWAVTVIGTVGGLLAVLGFTIFLGIFGTLVGLYAAAAASGVWLALRLSIAVVRMVLARRQRPV